MVSFIADVVAVVGIILLGYVICSHYQIHNDFGPVLSISFIIVINVICGCMSILWISSCFLMLFCYAIFFAYNYRRIDKKERAISFLHYMISPGIVGYIFASFLYLFVYTFIKSPQYVAWDDFMHWGLFYKNVFYFHNFDIWNNSFVFAHQSYPQGGAALYSFFAVLQKNYQEKDVFISLNSLIFAATASIFAFAKAGENKKRKILVYLMAISGVPFLYYQFMHYTMTYMDIPLGVSFAAGLSIIMTECPKKNKGKALAIEAGMLTSIKQTGIFFVVILLIIWGLSCIDTASFYVDQGKDISLNKKKEYIKSVFPATFVPAFIFLLWKSVIYLLGKSEDQFNSMGIKGFYSSCINARNGSDSYFYDIAKIYFEAIVKQKIVLNHFSIAFFGTALFIMGLCMYRVLIKKEKSYIIYIMPVFFLIYLLMLFYVYICGMSRAEGYELASFSRYVATFFIGWIHALVCAFFMLGTKLKNRKVVNVLYVIFVFICLLNMTFALKTDGISSISAGNEMRNTQVKYDQEIVKRIADKNYENKKIAFLFSKADSYEESVFIEAIPYDFFPYVTRSEVWYCNMLDKKKFEKQVVDTKTEYLFIYQSSLHFIDMNSYLFEDNLRNVSSTFSYKNEPVIYKVSNSESTNLKIFTLEKSFGMSN